MNPVIVGLEPSSGPGHSLPLDSSGASGRRLASSAGLRVRDYEARFDRTNIHSALGRSVRGDRDAATNLLSCLRSRRVVLLGRRVATAAGLRSSEWFEWDLYSPDRLDGVGLVVSSIPHPSGRSRWWNDPSNRVAYVGFMESLTRPTVYVEGPDGSGKTTLVDRLSRSLGLAVVPTDDHPTSSDECLRRIRMRLPPGIVCDRSSGLISELVYGPVLRGGTIVDEDYLWSVLVSLAGVVTVVYCRPPTEAVKPRRRPEESRRHHSAVVDNLQLLVDRYDLVMARAASIGVRVIRYDYTTTDLKEVSRCVDYWHI